MIGKENLRRVLRDLEKRSGLPSCRGELILEIQRELFGSVRISLQPSELARVFALIDDKPPQPTRQSPKLRPRDAPTRSSVRPSESPTSAAVC